MEENQSDHGCPTMLRAVLRPLCVALLAVAACNTPAPQAPAVSGISPAHADPFQKLARMEGSSFIEIGEVRARGDGVVAYCTAVRGLQVIDASAPYAMTKLHELKSALGGHKRFSRCQHLAWDQNILYHTNRGDRIQTTPYLSAFDLSGEKPTEVATFTKEGHTFEGIDADSGKLYATMHDAGLIIVERDGNRFRELGSLSGLHTAWAVDVVGDHAYVAEAKGSLAVVDVSDPTHPTLLGRVATGGSAQYVVVDQGVAYVAAASAGLVAVNVQNPGLPKIISRASTPGSALQHAIAGGRLYLADWSEVRVYDVTTPGTMRLLATENVATDEPFSRVLGIGAHKNIAFVGEWTGMYAFEFLPGRAAPDLSLGEHSIEFGNVAPGQTASTTLLLRNSGTRRLVASSIRVRGAGFSVDVEWLTIKPGENEMLTVNFRPSSDKQYTGQIVIESNDPDQPLHQLPVVGNRTSAGIGDLAPEITVALVDGGEWSLAEQRGKVVVLAYFATF